LAYDANFEQLLIDQGSYPDEHRHGNGISFPDPNNLNEIHQMLKRQRASLSSSRFSDEDFREFRKKAREASSEKKVMSSIFPLIRGDADILYEEDKLFLSLKPFTTGIANLKPDFYDGARPEQLAPRVRTDLRRYIVPSNQSSVPILPNFFTEGKGPQGSSNVARRQAFYDGTLGARAMHHLQSYRKGLVYDNNAYTITSTYHHDGLLRLFATYPTPSKNPGRSTEYHMIQLRSYSMTNTCETFRQGASAFRNARDWAKKQRDLFIYAANEIVRGIPSNLAQSFVPTSETSSSHSKNTGPQNAGPQNVGPQNSESSTDELARSATVKSKPKFRVTKSSSRIKKLPRIGG
jgi:hypothetical protein